MEYMFSWCISLTKLELGKNFNTSNIKYKQGTFWVVLNYPIKLKIKF